MKSGHSKKEYAIMLFKRLNNRNPNFFNAEDSLRFHQIQKLDMITIKRIVSKFKKYEDDIQILSNSQRIREI